MSYSPFADRHSPRAFVNLGIAMVLAISVLLPTFSAPRWIAAQEGPVDTDVDLYEPIVESLRGDIFAATEGELTRYRVDAEFTPTLDDRLARIEGTVALNFINITPAALEEIYIRLYPNADEYGDGGMRIENAGLDDTGLDVALSVDDTLATIALVEPLPTGETIDLEIAFTSIIPTDPAGSYGMFSYDEQTGSYALAHWLPLIAGFDPARGWELGPLSTIGDPVFTNAALFDVALTAPEDFVVVATGNEIETTPAAKDTVTRHFVSGPVRDFVMAIDDDFEVESITVGDTVVNSYYNPGHDEAGLEVLTTGAQSLELFNELLGGYPYAEMDLVEIDLGNGAGGVEFPQIMFIGSDYYGANGAVNAIPGFLEFIVAHEVAHQWFYGLVGNNQYQDAFIDEGLSNYLTVVYFVETYGPEAGEEQVNLNLKASYFAVLFEDGDQVVHQPTDDFPSQRSYGAIIYGKAALGFAAINEEIGDEAFYAALQAYVDAFRFEVARPADLLAAFEAASGLDLDELWRHWFEAVEGREDYDAADLARLLRDIGR